MEHVKYARTPHLPWSPGRSSDDGEIEALASLRGCSVIVTEKMDGECTTLYRDGCHARSLDSQQHSSRDHVCALQGRIAHLIPEDIRICGENLYARHAITYDALPAFFLVFGIYQRDTCLSWPETTAWCGRLGLEAVPSLYEGPWDEQRIKACFRGVSRCVRAPLAEGTQEGYVVRDAGSFPATKFTQRVAKYVRAGHIQTDAHWLQRPVVPNRLGALRKP